MGTLELRLTDGGAAGLKEVWVSVARVDVCGPSGWWTVFPAQADAPLEVDLLSLRNSESLELARTRLPAGRYSAVRFVLDQSSEGNRVVTALDVCPISVAASCRQAVEEAHQFTIRPGAVSSLTIDFDLSASLRRTAEDRYVLAPCLRVLETAECGSIEGVVTDSQGNPVPGAVVSAQEAGQASTTGRRVAQTAETGPEGRYCLGSVPPGSYTVVVVAAEGQPYAVAYREVSVPAGVLVGQVDFALAPAQLVELAGSVDLEDPPEDVVPQVAIFLGGLWVEVGQVDVWAQDCSFSVLLPAGIYDLMYFAEGYETFTHPLVDVSSSRRLDGVTLLPR
jgi:hypothetical protein